MSEESIDSVLNDIPRLPIHAVWGLALKLEERAKQFQEQKHKFSAYAYYVAASVLYAELDSKKDVERSHNLAQKIRESEQYL